MTADIFHNEIRCDIFQALWSEICYTSKTTIFQKFITDCRTAEGKTFKLLYDSRLMTHFIVEIYCTGVIFLKTIYSEMN